MSRRKRKEVCNKYRRAQALKHQGEPHLTLIQGYNNEDYTQTRRKSVSIHPRNENQALLLEYLNDYNVDMVFAIGPAGTGKTLISTLAGIRELKDRAYNKFVITRPAVSVDEEHGFLPGTLQEKMAPWTRPILDIFEDYYSVEQIEYMVKDHKLEIAPLAFMRGRTFKHSFIIADEMQNATPNQMKMLLTRIGEGTKMVITGDLDQHDRGFADNGLKDFVERLMFHSSDRIRVVRFDADDIERHPVIEEVLSLYQ